MVIVYLHTILGTEPRIVTGELRFWGDVEEYGKDKLVWEFENCEKRMRQINVRLEVTREVILRLVWGAGEDRDFDNGLIGGRCFPPNPDANLVKNVEVLSRPRPMVDNPVWQFTGNPRRWVRAPVSVASGESR